MATDRRDSGATSLSAEFVRDSDSILRLAMESLFERLNSICEGAIAVDRQARVVWIPDKYVSLLGLSSAEEALGRDIEEVIPNSLMRHVVETGEPILLDVMEHRDQQFVVTRIPLLNARNEVIGAVGFVIYDKLHYLKPLMGKFAKLQLELSEAKQRLAEQRRPKYTFASIVGTSPAIMELKRHARRAAEQQATVLLLGETGTGKELLAQAIHAASARANGPFIGVNMAAIPETLLEAEFFGAVAGAYTGANRKGREGKFKLADGGTLFLDEVSDMPLHLQPKLLRVLQEQEIEPLGCNRVIKVDVRVIAASSTDLKKLCEQGRFRTDLYYRLNVLPIALPPLRERLADLEPLCEHILEVIAERTGNPVRQLAPSALERLAAYSWPGNVRELRNVLEQATVLSDKRVLGVDDFAAILPPALADEAPPAPQSANLARAVEDLERQKIRQALAAAAGKVGAAARLLGVSRATLYKKLSSLGIRA
jgi:transcriptional regulator with PAS, ATPase and Fis domain